MWLKSKYLKIITSFPYNLKRHIPIKINVNETYSTVLVDKQPYAVRTQNSLSQEYDLTLLLVIVRSKGS